jgi:SfnB family sulfur acquisition oxidoreductase
MSTIDIDLIGKIPACLACVVSYGADPAWSKTTMIPVSLPIRERTEASERPLARRIATDAAALAAAREIAAVLAEGAAVRDRERRLPYRELDLLSQSGLLALTVPRALGGADISAETLAEVFVILAAGDTAIGQIPQSHYYMMEALRLAGTPDQQARLFGLVLDGGRVANALAERGTASARELSTTIRRDGEGWRLNGRKYYSTGALFADWLAVVALDEAGRRTIAFVPADTPGISLIDDWTGFGQRTTGSGTTVLDNVAVAAGDVVSLQDVFDTPTRMGPFAQLMHAAIDQGAARAALADTITFVRTRARPWDASHGARAADDPHTIAAIGEVRIRVGAADALLARAARFVDAARDAPTATPVAEASIAVAEAKVAATEASLLAGSKLIELGGSSATLMEHGLDRHWRNARTHTVHDPVRWKLDAIGRYFLSGTLPPRHGAI